MRYDYRVVWSGGKDQSLSLGGLSFLNGIPKYFIEDKLPMLFSSLNKLPGVVAIKGEFIDPTDTFPEGTSPIQTNKMSNVGVVWKGTSRIRVVTIKGKRVSLENGVPNFEFSSNEVEEVIRTNSYVEKVNR